MAFIRLACYLLFWGLRLHPSCSSLPVSPLVSFQTLRLIAFIGFSCVHGAKKWQVSRTVLADNLTASSAKVWRDTCHRCLCRSTSALRDSSHFPRIPLLALWRHGNLMVFLSVFQAQLQRSLDNSVSAQPRPLIGRRSRKEARMGGRRSAASGQDPGILDVEDEEEDEVRNLQSQILKWQSYCNLFCFSSSQMKQMQENMKPKSIPLCF